MRVMFFGDFNVVMAEEFGNGIDIHTAHDKVAGKSRAEHFDTWFCTQGELMVTCFQKHC